MLTRRYHCRQCGRVVCHACSTHRELIASLYVYVLVRVCNDCQPQMLRPIQPNYPNPEIDYALATRKVRGVPAECDEVLQHAEIVREVIRHRCEALLPMEPLTPSSFRMLRDSLALAEKWSLALEVSLKLGFSTTGVMAAWGIACLKSGCFETAREKFAHCMSKPADCSDEYLFRIHTSLTHDTDSRVRIPDDYPQVKRPAKSPPLLAEIISILENTCHPAQADFLARASIIRRSVSSTTASVVGKSTASAQRRMATSVGDLPCHETAMNILHTLANLKHIVNGTFKVAFLERHRQTRVALKYLHYQQVDALCAHVLHGARALLAALLIRQMFDLYETLAIWHRYVQAGCAYLERTGMLNSLYLLQLLLRDPIRASMTCVRFYERGTLSYMDQQAQSFHLTNSEQHLSRELDACQ